MIRVHDTYEYSTVFTQEDVETFANLTNDMNPIHIDKNYAMKSKFGRQVVQGVLISCAFSKVFGTLWPGAQDSYFISQEILYLKPVYINEDYIIKFECTAVDNARAIGTIVAIMKDNSGNEVVKLTARIASETEFFPLKL